MPIYSHSRLSTFEQCPLKFKYAYLDRVGMKRRTIEAFMGSRFHEALEHLYSRIAFDPPDVQALKGYFEQRWDEQWSDDVEILQKGKTHQDYKTIGLKAVEDYYRRHAPFEEGHVLGLEKDIIADLDGTGSYRLRCIIDRLMKRPDGVYEIHDYKTSATLPPQAKLDEDRQLALYEIAVRQAWPQIERVELVWHYVCFDMELRSQRTPEQLRALSESIRGLIDSIEATTEFRPQESALCAWCDFQRICPLFAHRFQTEDFGTIDYESDAGQALVNAFSALDAQKHELAARIKAIEAEQERLKDIAGNIADTQGVKRLYGDDHMLTIRDELKVRYPRKGELSRNDFETTMKTMGLWDNVTDVSWSALKALAEQEGWHQTVKLPAKLQPFLEIEAVKHFRLATRKERKY